MEAHAQELASAKGEVEGQNVMPRWRITARRELEEKRAKIKSLQAELSRAVAKSKQIKDQSEMAKAARQSRRRDARRRRRRCAAGREANR